MNPNRFQGFRYRVRNSAQRWVDAPQSNVTSFTCSSLLGIDNRNPRLSHILSERDDLRLIGGSQKWTSVHTESGPGCFREGCTCTLYIPRPGRVLYLVYSRPLRRRLESSTSIRPGRQKSRSVHESANIGFKNETYLSKVASCSRKAWIII